MGLTDVNVGSCRVGRTDVEAPFGHVRDTRDLLSPLKLQQSVGHVQVVPVWSRPPGQAQTAYKTLLEARQYFLVHLGLPLVILTRAVGYAGCRRNQQQRQR